jgi:hypothetical protein
MFILTIKGMEDEGAYALENEIGEKILLLFKESDDAERYALMLEENDDEELLEMHVVEVDDRIAIKTCEMYNYDYNVITPEDIIIPPKKIN